VNVTSKVQNGDWGNFDAMTNIGVVANETAFVNDVKLHNFSSHPNSNGLSNHKMRLSNA